MTRNLICLKVMHQDLKIVYSLHLFLNVFVFVL